MDTIISAVTPLRQRMLEDMRMRKLKPRTQEAYVRAVRKLSAFLHRAPDTATVEDLRNFQLHLVDSGTSPITLNATLTGLRFFFDITVGRLELMAKMQPVKFIARERAVATLRHILHIEDADAQPCMPTQCWGALVAPPAEVSHS
jgi:site-specific recombinase XerD